MEQETYILRTLVDGVITETAKSQNKEVIDELITNSEKNMRDLGYVKTRFYRVRIDKKYITTYTIEYVRK